MKKKEVLKYIERMQRITEVSASTDEEMFKIRGRLEVLQELHKAFEDWGLRFTEDVIPMQKEAELLYSAIKDSPTYQGETIEELRQKLLKDKPEIPPPTKVGGSLSVI